MRSDVPIGTCLSGGFDLVGRDLHHGSAREGRHGSAR
ncbi:hypothetical protein ACF1BQ_007825 [Bradyrhizobium sp. RDT10]